MDTSATAPSTSGLGAGVAGGVGHVDAGECGEGTVGAARDPGVADRQLDLVVGRDVGADLEDAAAGRDRRRRGRGRERRHARTDRRWSVSLPVRAGLLRTNSTDQTPPPRSRTLTVTEPVKPALPAVGRSTSVWSSAWYDAAVAYVPVVTVTVTIRLVAAPESTHERERRGSL